MNVDPVANISPRRINLLGSALTRELRKNVYDRNFVAMERNFVDLLYSCEDRRRNSDLIVWAGRTLARGNITILPYVKSEFASCLELRRQGVYDVPNSRHSQAWRSELVIYDCLLDAFENEVSSSLGRDSEEFQEELAELNKAYFAKLYTLLFVSTIEFMLPVDYLTGFPNVTEDRSEIANRFEQFISEHPDMLSIPVEDARSLVDDFHKAVRIYKREIPNDRFIQGIDVELVTANYHRAIDIIEEANKHDYRISDFEYGELCDAIDLYRRTVQKSKLSCTSMQPEEFAERDRAKQICQQFTANDSQARRFPVLRSIATRSNCNLELIQMRQS